jgi:DNA/RNA endonuclease G (NUC1)
MASTILAEAVKKKIEDGAGGDWIIGGDFNAELATDDFAKLSKGGMVPASAVDELDGSISYIKGPKSLIDHIFLSPNLAKRYGPKDYFIVAAEKQFPSYIDEISDHRPVLFRMALNGGQERAAALRLERTDRPAVSPSLRDLQSRIKDRLLDAQTNQNSVAAVPASLEYRSPPDADDYSDRTGYDPRFLDNGDTEIAPPRLPDDLAEKAVVVDDEATGMDRFLLPYTHFSVVMNGERRMAYFTAVNIDGNESLKIPRKGNRWYIDPRIPAHYQVGNELYRDNDLDRGHMVRRLDPVWGERSVARTANEDTFHYTNACPQHKDLNQKEWNDLEDYILDNAGAYGLRVCVFTGPILRDTDRPYRDLVLLPEDFWKVAVIVREGTGQLSATGYVLTQKDMIADLEFAYGAFRTYQVSLRAIERMTGLDFGSLKAADPKGRRDDVESAGFPGDERPTLVTGPESLVF